MGNAKKITKNNPTWVQHSIYWHARTKPELGSAILILGSGRKQKKVKGLLEGLKGTSSPLQELEQGAIGPQSSSISILKICVTTNTKSM